MKLTRRELNLIIESELKSEGLWDAIKSVGSTIGDMAMSVAGEPTKSELISWGGEDAAGLWQAMKGLGTDENRVREILEKRANDLDVLYEEYQKLIRGEMSFRSGAAKGVIDQVISFGMSVATAGGTKLLDSLAASEDNVDLVDWLIDDGMDAEAEMVTAALAQAGKQRSKPFLGTSLSAVQDPTASQMANIEKLSIDDMSGDQIT